MAPRRPKLPALTRPRTNDTQLQRWIDAATEWLETRDGNTRRGNELDAFLTRREAVEIGLLQRQSRANGAPLVPRPQPGDSGLLPPEMSVPPPVTGLIAGAAVQTIVLSWDNPAQQYRNHSYVEVWRAEVDDLGQATMVGQSAGVMYTDSVGPGSAYYYWVRAVSTSDVEGPFNAVSGIYAETGLDVPYLLEKLTDQVTKDQLFQDLRSEINLITDPDSVTGSVNSRLKAAREDLQQEIDVINGVLSDIQSLPAFDSSQTWEEGDLVRFNGELHRARQDMLTTPTPDPTDTNYWEKVGEYASLGEAVAAHALLISDHSTRVSETEEGLSAEVQRTDALQAAVEDPATGLSTKASLTELDTAKSDIFGADVSQFSEIDAAFSNQQQDIDTRATVTQLNQAASDAEDGAVATATQQVYTTLGGNQATVETKAESWDGVSAQWSAKTQVGDLVAGMGIMISGGVSRVYVDAARFAVYDSNATMSGDLDDWIPFAVANGITHIKQAAILDASIDTAKIADAFLDNLTAAKGNLAQARIQKGDIFNLTVGGIIQSDSYVPGLSGFNFNQDGSFDVAGGTFRGAVTFTSPPGNQNEIDALQLDNAPNEAGADKTGDHTSADTAAVAGTSAATVRDRANNANTRVNDWKRPNDTTIDGNKLSTAVAYVDTLVIKGGAVNHPVSVYEPGVPSSTDPQYGIFAGKSGSWALVAELTISTGYLDTNDNLTGGDTVRLEAFLLGRRTDSNNGTYIQLRIQRDYNSANNLAQQYDINGIGAWDMHVEGVQAANPYALTVFDDGVVGEPGTYTYKLYARTGDDGALSHNINIFSASFRAKEIMR